MPLESRLQKWPRYYIGFVRQELRLHSMNPRRLLQGLDDMREQPQFDLAGIGEAVAIGHVEVANHTLAALVHEERVTEDAPAIHGRISWQDFRVDIPQNHLRRSGIVPQEQPRPDQCLLVEQRTQVHRRKMPKVEDLQRAPAAATAKNSGKCRGKISSVVGSRGGGKRHEQAAATCVYGMQRPVFKLTLPCDIGHLICTEAWLSTTRRHGSNTSNPHAHTTYNGFCC